MDRQACEVQKLAGVTWENRRGLFALGVFPVIAGFLPWEAICILATEKQVQG